jgi:uncharacterized protein (TIGR03067 family)
VDRPSSGLTLIISKGKITRKLTSRFRSRDVVQTYKVDTRKSPPHIDMATSGSKRINYAIYKIEGDRLSMAYPSIDASSRPKDFDSGRQTMVYRRKKK